MDANYPLLFVQNLFRDLIQNVTLIIAALLLLLLNVLKHLSSFVQIIHYLMHSKHPSLPCNTLGLLNITIHMAKEVRGKICTQTPTISAL